MIKYGNFYIQRSPKYRLNIEVMETVTRTCQEDNIFHNKGDTYQDEVRIGYFSTSWDAAQGLYKHLDLNELDNHDELLSFTRTMQEHCEEIKEAVIGAEI